MTEEVKVLVVDDHQLLRIGVRDAIGRESRFKIVGEAANGEEALQLIPTLKPDIVITDIDMPRLNGLDTLRAMRKLPIQAKVIILTMYNEEDMFNAAMDLGVKAYVLKENAATDILVALDKVCRGETFLSSPMSDAGKRRGDRVRELIMSRPQLDALTPAERRILKLIGEDYTSKEIADRLGLSVRTVDNHRQHICNKLKLHGTHSLLKFAFDNSSRL
jgi:DNA-binding NarL/FixJ family response regulator